MSDRKLGPVASRILSAVECHGEDAWVDLSWSDPYTTDQVYGAVSQSVRQGWLVQTGGQSFALTELGAALLGLVRAEERFEAARQAQGPVVAASLATLGVVARSGAGREAETGAMMDARLVGASLAEIAGMVGLTAEGVRQRLDRWAINGAVKA